MSLEDALNGDLDEKVNWLISNQVSTNKDIEAIKNNHLSHIENDMATLKQRIWWMTAFIISVVTGQNVML
jgi:hypothetical protein|tara:strand:+ start:280 stop:489 length:210 start_codon:yes stop_codon:yes gene_type:complete